MTTQTPTRAAVFPATSLSHAAPRSVLYIADGLVYLLWLSVASFALSHHEKWGDEAQSWLIARDLSLPRIWFYELRYEGTPGLWHTILWISQHIFHMPYAGIGPLGLCFAAAGAAFILWRAPFPRPVRYLLLFSYFILYQYAIIARSYTLLPLLLFAAVSFFHDREHPERITVLLVLLSQVSVHGALVADAIALCYAIDTLRNWNSLSERARRWFFLGAAILVADNLFIYLVLKPTPDVGEFAIKANTPPPLDGLMAILSGAFLDSWIPSSILLVILGAWFYMRRRLLEFLLPLILMLVLYVKVHGVRHHHGTAFLAVVASLWIAWPSPDEQHGFNLFQRRCLQGISLLLVLWFGLNVWDAAGTIRMEETVPYSGAHDAANYLRPLVAQGGSIYGYDFSMNAIQAYYDRNIFANQRSAYCHLDLLPRAVDYDEIMTAKPDNIAVMVSGYITGDPVTDLPYYERDFGLAGYDLVHVSPGWMIYKQAKYDGQFYLVFARKPTGGH